MTMTKINKSAAEYLQQPYTRQIIPDQESGTFTAQILEFPGCITQGDSAAEAYANLEDAATAWIEASQEQGQTIPMPFETGAFSGKVALRMPRSLHRRAAETAHREGVSLNHFLVATIAEKIGSVQIVVTQSSWDKPLAANIDTVPTGIGNAVLSPAGWGDFGNVAGNQPHGKALTSIRWRGEKEKQHA